VRFIQIRSNSQEEIKFSFYPVEQLIHCIFWEGQDIINIKFKTKEYLGDVDDFKPSHFYDFLSEEHEKMRNFIILIREH